MWRHRKWYREPLVEFFGVVGLAFVIAIPLGFWIKSNDKQAEAEDSVTDDLGEYKPGWPPKDDRWYIVWFVNDTGLGIHHKPKLLRWAPRYTDYLDPDFRPAGFSHPAYYFQIPLSPHEIKRSKE